MRRRLPRKPGRREECGIDGQQNHDRTNQLRTSSLTRESNSVCRIWKVLPIDAGRATSIDGLSITTGVWGCQEQVMDSLPRDHALRSTPPDKCRGFSFSFLMIRVTFRAW